MKPVSVALFASGRGSNFEALMDAHRAGFLPMEVKALVCDRPGAPVVEKARALGIPVFEIPVPKGGDLIGRRKAHEEQILQALAARGLPHFLIFAGYMRVVGPTLLSAFRSPRGYHRIVNIHPSLLPAFPGKGGYAQAFDYGCTVAGVTIHLVDDGVDQGPICAQETFPMGECADASAVERRGLEVEHRLYVETLQWVLPEAFHLEGRKIRRDRVS